MLRKVMAATRAQPEVAPLLSDDHFSVDGTLFKARTTMSSFQPSECSPPPGEEDAGGPLLPATDETPATPDQPETPWMTAILRQDLNPEVEFHGEKRSNATSVTGPDARLYKKAPGTGAVFCFMGRTLMENRNATIVQADLTHAEGIRREKPLSK